MAGSCIRTFACDDNNRCTLDNCNFGTCSNTQISCNDGRSCTLDRCDSVTRGCYYEERCDDGNPCTSDSCGFLGSCRRSNYPE
ncbi:MAG: hypothetical protein NT157_02710, partial [Candidatus Micrarchaeota archaeon]|nr:hypothetical protein [Candidatus Micrarchaeota archaeon]